MEKNVHVKVFSLKSFLLYGTILHMYIHVHVSEQGIIIIVILWFIIPSTSSGYSIALWVVAGH